MDTKKTLLAAAVGLLLVSAVGVVAAPDALVDPREGDERPGDIRIADTVVSPGEIRGETAELELGLDLQHRGSTVENVTVRHRAIGADSGLLVDETTIAVGDVDVEGEQTVSGAVDVERSGGYRIETVVFVDGERRTGQTTRVGGVEALTPDYADSRVGFTEGAVWPTVAVSVVDADNTSATLSVSVSVTNRGDTISDDVDLRLLVRQADSNVIADEARETVGSVRPGRTDTVTTTVEVPATYNYYLDAALFDDDVRIDETQGVANLNPQETISAEETVEDVEFAVEDFAEATDDASRPVEDVDEVDDVAEDTGDDAPGFGVVVAVAALLVAALYARRHR